MAKASWNFQLTNDNNQWLCSGQLGDAKPALLSSSPEAQRLAAAEPLPPASRPQRK